MTALCFVGAIVFLGLLNGWEGTFPPIGMITAQDLAFIVAIATTSGILSLFIYYYGLQFTRASVATIAELSFPLAAVFMNARFIPGHKQPGALFGLAAGQWVGALMLLGAIYMLSGLDEQRTE